MWDLDLFFFQPDPTQAETTWPGFHIQSGKSARHTAASRKRDTVALYLRLEGVPGLSPRVPEQLAQRAVQVYLQTHGSVTRALHEAAIVVHQRIAQANRRLAQRTLQARGWLLAFVLRGDILYLAWAGPWHVLATVRGHLHRWHDPERSGPGLGLEVALQFAQVPLRFPLAVLAADHLDALTEEEVLALPETPETLLRQWLTRIRSPRGGLLARWDTGTYRVTKTYLPIAVAEGEPATVIVKEREPAAPDDVATEVPPGEPSVAQGTKKQAPRPRREPGRFRRGMETLVVGILTLLDRIMRVRVPTRILVVLSVLLPLLVMSLTVVRYMREGRKLRHEQWLALAETHFQRALQQPDPHARRAGVEDALQALYQAETYQHSEASAQFKSQLYRWLETWEFIYPLPFQDVLEAQLPPDVRIHRLAAGAQGIYALDTQNQMVWFFPFVDRHPVLEHDQRFRCSLPGNVGFEAGPLVDVLTLDPRDTSYELAAFDEQGNMLLCNPDREPLLRMLPVPTRPWQRIFRVRAFEDRLYVLDVGAANIFVLEALSPTASVPRALFPQADARPDLAQVVDFALWRGELFLLFVDGRVTRCTFLIQEEGKTVCEDLPFQDRRPEREGRIYALWPDTRFTSITLYRGPEPSLFLLDAAGGRVFRFSLKLRYLAEYRPETPWPQTPTGFVLTEVGGTPYLFVATANDVYAAALP